MGNRTERVSFYATPSLQEELRDLAEEKSLSKSEIVRRGTLNEMRKLRSDGCDNE
jgi:hypothetical protein